MADSFCCPQGHRWQGPPICPACGSPPVTGPAAEPDTPATIVLEGSTDDCSAADDRTIADGSVPGLAIGKVIGTQYEILAELGRGGMGVVYKARQLRLNRLVALKMILAGAHAGPQELIRFKVEAETLAPLRHANIVQIYEVGDFEGHPWFSLEYIEGGSLAQQLNGVPVPSRPAAQLIETIARAMHFAHQRGIVHRDLKPANILLQIDECRLRNEELGDSQIQQPAICNLQSAIPKITDFGLAKKLEADAGHTRSGAILGTPSYIAPEQAAGQKNVGTPADVYSLGAILYEMLTGRPPFRGETSMDTMLQVMTAEPVPPSGLQPKVPRDLETICLKCLGKIPSQRYGSAQELADDLRRFLNGEPIVARPAGALQRVVKWAGRRPALAALLAVSLFALLTLLAVSLFFNAELAVANRKEQDRAAEADRQRQQAEQARTAAVAAQEQAEEQSRIARERLELARRSVFSFQLMQSALLAGRDPLHSLALLQDPQRCPSDLRDFTWGYLNRLCHKERATLAGATGSVAKVVFVPDGSTLAALCGDDSVLLWDPAQPAKARSFQPRHTGPTVDIALSPDGKTLASAGFDKLVKLWDVSTGKEIAALVEHTLGVRVVAFSPDGSLLASGGHDRTAIVWDLASRKPRAILPGHKAAISGLAFTADGRTLVTASHDRTIRIWDIAGAREKTAPLEGHTDVVWAVTLSPDGKQIASASADRTVRLWNLAGQPLAVLRGHSESVNGVAFAPSGLLLASAGSDRTIKLWDPATGQERGTLKGHTGPVRTLAFTSDGRTLASGGGDSQVKLWDLANQARLPFRIDLGQDATHAAVIAWSGDGQTLAVVSHRDRLVRLWDLLTEKEQVCLQGYTRAIEALALSPDGTLLAVGFDDHHIRLHELSTGRSQPPWTGHQAHIQVLRFAPDNRTLASADRDGKVRLWDVATGKVTGQEEHPGAVRALAFSSDGKRLAAASERGQVRLWDIIGGSSSLAIADLPFSVDQLAFAPDSQTLAVIGSTQLVFWDALRRQTRARLKLPAGPGALAFTADSRTLATGQADGDITLWDPVIGQERATLSGHTGLVQALSFTADGRALLSVGQDGVVQVWQGSK